MRALRTQTLAEQPFHSCTQPFAPTGNGLDPLGNARLRKALWMVVLQRFAAVPGKANTTNSCALPANQVRSQSSRLYPSYSKPSGMRQLIGKPLVRIFPPPKVVIHA